MVVAGTADARVAAAATPPQLAADDAATSRHEEAHRARQSHRSQKLLMRRQRLRGDCGRPRPTPPTPDDDAVGLARWSWRPLDGVVRASPC